MIKLSPSQPGVSVPLEDVEVSVVCDLSSDCADLLWIEEFGRRALELFPLEVVAGRSAQRAAHTAVINTRQQSQGYL